MASYIEYTRPTNCGNLTMRIDGWRVSVEMENFGDCAAYKFISNQITKKIALGEDPAELARYFQEYKCNKGEKSCLQAIGECLEEEAETIRERLDHELTDDMIPRHESPAGLLLQED